MPLVTLTLQRARSREFKTAVLDTEDQSQAGCRHHRRACARRGARSGERDDRIRRDGMGELGIRRRAAAAR